MQTDDRVVEPGENDDPQASKLADISREMVRLYKEQFGRGPTRARSEFAGADLIVCTLEDTLTPAERRMAQFGDHQRLRDLRLYFQYATKAQFCDVIERALGRKVRAFISGMDTSKDVAAELFYLESAG
ncbi:MAG TPA: Na-translocating system protein MpsC family protein [Solirubrobacterales bacterium]|nr:Na-translocating system protein MpsC family protein [Solirubrobacterales bacterium]